MENTLNRLVMKYSVAEDKSEEMKLYKHYMDLREKVKNLLKLVE